jgi:uncharacterized protein YukE
VSSGGSGLAGAGAGAKAYSGLTALVGDVKDGNVLATGKDVWDLGSLASDVDKFASGASDTIVEDPLEALIQAGLGFLIDLIAPLKEALNLVTGDPDGLNGKAEDWAGVAEDLRALGPTVVQDAQATDGSWTGPAADAFRTKIERFERGVLSVAGQADHVAQLLRVSATLMDAAQSIIKGIIASWVEYAILTEAAAAAAAPFTFGASEAAGQAAVAGEAAVACGRGADTVAQASGMLERMASAVRELEGSFSQLARALDEEAAAMRDAESTLRSASDTFTQAARTAAQESYKDGLTEGIAHAFTDAGKDTAIGLGDDAIKGAEGGTDNDGNETQQQIDDDLSFN